MPQGRERSNRKKRMRSRNGWVHQKYTTAPIGRRRSGRHEKARRSRSFIVWTSRFIQNAVIAEKPGTFFDESVDRGVREMSFVNCCLAAIRVSCQPKRSIKATAHRAEYDPFVAPSSFELVCDVITAPPVLNTSSGPSPTSTLNAFDSRQRINVVLPLAPSTYRNLTLVHCVCHIKLTHQRICWNRSSFPYQRIITTDCSGLEREGRTGQLPFTTE